MDPFQFLLLAEMLLREHSYPASWRTAISRAYYAAHHCIKDFVEGAGVQVVGGAAAHADVWRHLDNSGDAEMEQVGSDLADLHSDRNDADYRLTKIQIQNQKTADARVRHARSLIEAVRNCRADPKRYDRIKKAIRARNKELRGQS